MQTCVRDLTPITDVIKIVLYNISMAESLPNKDSGRHKSPKQARRNRVGPLKGFPFTQIILNLNHSYENN